MAAKIDLISNALILIGDVPINTLDGNDRRQVVASNLYDGIVKAELSKFHWSFARKKAQLAKTTDTVVDSEWQSVYQLPTDLLSLIKLRPSVPYQIYGDKIYTNASGALYCDYTADVNEAAWPDDFAKMIEYALAVDFAMSITGNANAQAYVADKYLNQSRMARSKDSLQRPTIAIVDAPFIDVRN